jgi:hypothetical protein
MLVVVGRLEVGGLLRERQDITRREAQSVEMARQRARIRGATTPLESARRVAGEIALALGQRGEGVADHLRVEALALELRTEPAAALGRAPQSRLDELGCRPAVVEELRALETIERGGDVVRVPALGEELPLQLDPEVRTTSEQVERRSVSAVR